jgi:hypothetical protein
MLQLSFIGSQSTENNKVYSESTCSNTTYLQMSRLHGMLNGNVTTGMSVSVLLPGSDPRRRFHKPFRAVHYERSKPLPSFIDMWACLSVEDVA